MRKENNHTSSLCGSNDAGGRQVSGATVKGRDTDGTKLGSKRMNQSASNCGEPATVRQSEATRKVES